MKGKTIITALFIAAVAALLLGQGAFASAGVTDKSDPLCTPFDSSDLSHKIVLCTDKMTVEIQKSSGIYASVEPVPTDTNLPNAPKVNFIGPATIIKVVDSKGQPVKAVYMQICFKDATKANIFRWWTADDWKTWYSAKDTARWVYSPTTRNISGMSCTSSWLPGIFTIN